MKYCINCGEKLEDDSKYCPKCGKKVDEFDNGNPVFNNNDIRTNFESNTKVWTTIKILTLIFMIAGICFSVFSVFTVYFNNNGSGFEISIPFALLWQIPMTIYYYKAVVNRKKIGIGFKVCSLIFVSLVAGILMLCDKEAK